MNLKKSLIIFFLLTVISFLIGLVLNYSFFNIFFGISLLMLFIAFLLLMAIITRNLVIRLLPLKIKEKIKDFSSRFNLIVLICVTIFIIAGWLINYHLLPDMFHPISLMSDVIIVLFTLSFGWSLITFKKKRTILISILFLVFISILSLIDFKSEKQNIQDSDINRKNALAKLEALPYFSWSKQKVVKSESGVLKNKKNKTQSGYNLYTDIEEHAYLMDMDGEIIFSWKFPPIKGRWVYVELLDDGTIVAICTGKCFAKIDKNSKVIWIKHVPAHHDIEVLPDGSYLVPVFLPPVMYNLRKLRFDSILHFSENGEILDEWSCYANWNKLKVLHPSNFMDEQYSLSKVILDIYSPAKTLYFILRKTNENKIRGSKKFYLDSFQAEAPFPLSVFHNIFPGKIDKILGISGFIEYYHLNTIEILPETPLGKIDKRFQQGNHLICLRNTNTIFILDKNTKDVVWSWGPGVLDRPHMPTMLDNGNILVYDNGTHRTYSRILEINPLDNHIIWEYKADPPETFYSDIRGSNQRFSNGNTLICESETGRVFEVTPQGEIIWEFLNPEIKEEKRKIIYRMMRITDAGKVSFIN